MSLSSQRIAKVLRDIRLMQTLVRTTSLVNIQRTKYTDSTRRVDPPPYEPCPEVQLMNIRKCPACRPGFIWKNQPCYLKTIADTESCDDVDSGEATDCGDANESNDSNKQSKTDYMHSSDEKDLSPPTDLPVRMDSLYWKDTPNEEKLYAQYTRTWKEFANVKVIRSRNKMVNYESENE